ncbi:MAG: tripartite tricarboxylate transporter substrate binding protein [Streptosporangiaceae bacterium]
MKGKRFVAAAAVAALGTLTACGGSEGGTSASGEGADYPKGPVTVTAPADPGSGWDTTARALVETLQKEDLVKSPLPVQNRPGATGSVWLSQMITSYKGADDQIAITSLPIMSNQLRGRTKNGYEDVTMIARLFTEYYIVVVPASSKYKSLKDLVGAIKANPKSVPVGAAGDDRLPFGLVVKAGGGDPKSINFINYEGGGDEITALLNGDVQAAVAGVSEFRGQLLAGKLRGLGVLREKRLAAPLDNVPTAKEQGYDVTLANWRGVYGPPDMPDYAVKYWRSTLKKAMRTGTWKKFAKRNQWTTTYMDGREMKQYLEKTNADIKDALRSIGQYKSG